MNKLFDLNIIEILEDWKVYHAIREIIANAFDETILSNAKKQPLIELNSKTHELIIEDFGRGISIENLTQNESNEKMSSNIVIGRFGVGLKDAIATFHRNQKNIKIFVKDLEISFKESPKQNFEDIITLHAVVKKTKSNIIGTKFLIENISDEQFLLAKSLFLQLNNPTVIQETKYGMIINDEKTTKSIYINGLKLSEEVNFAYSYNITKIDAKIKKSLNRERKNLGRSVYSKQIEKILMSSNIDDLKLLKDSYLIDEEKYDEYSWSEVKLMLLNSFDNIAIVTTDMIINNPDQIERMRSEGKMIKSVSSNTYLKVSSSELSFDTFDSLNDEYESSFTYDFVKIIDLNKQQKKNLEYAINIAELIGYKATFKSFDLKISKITQNDYDFNTVKFGHCDHQNKEIILNTKALKDKYESAMVLVHELTHAKTSCQDATRNFEQHLDGNFKNLLKNIK